MFTKDIIIARINSIKKEINDLKISLVEEEQKFEKIRRNKTVKTQKI